MLTFLFVSHGESGVLESGKPNADLSGEVRGESSLQTNGQLGWQPSRQPCTKVKPASSYSFTSFSHYVPEDRQGGPKYPLLSFFSPVDPLGYLEFSKGLDSSLVNHSSSHTSPIPENVMRV